MATVNVLIVVDVEGALASGNLSSNVYLVDTNKYMGSYNEGQTELVTVLAVGDMVIWSVAPIDPGTSVAIQSFSGAAIGQQVTPVFMPLTGSWGSKFSAVPPTSGTQFQYSVNLQFEGGAILTFDPFLQTK